MISSQIGSARFHAETRGWASVMPVLMPVASRFSRLGRSSRSAVGVAIGRLVGPAPRGGGGRARPGAGGPT